MGFSEIIDVDAMMLEERTECTKDETTQRLVVHHYMKDPKKEPDDRHSPALLVALGVLAFCAIIMVAELGSLIILASKKDEPAAIIIHNGGSGETIASGTFQTTNMETAVDVVPNTVISSSFRSGANVCEGKKPDLPDAECIVDALLNVGPQSGANVTKGFQGDLEVDHAPIITPYWMNGMCPVNVHWHLGAEHLSQGEYDESGVGPGRHEDSDIEVDSGFRCKLYNENDSKFIKEYDWKHCVDMKVGETYEVHWPHSAAGACGTANQYQTPFYDGVFCMDGVLTDTASQIGVQAQVFTIVNDEQYYWPDLMRGMVVDDNAMMGTDVAKYTGSTTGSGRNNLVCSQYSPITWQVDRKCHIISASSFDQMCADMKSQRDDMSLDLAAHGSRALVDGLFVANNQHNRRLRRST